MAFYAKMKTRFEWLNAIEGEERADQRRHLIESQSVPESLWQPERFYYISAPKYITRKSISEYCSNSNVSGNAHNFKMREHKTTATD